MVKRTGSGALLEKSDIESAFRLLPVHPDCYHLLGCIVDDFFIFFILTPSYPWGV